MITLLRNFVTHDLGLKLFALALALIIWATVRFAGVAGPQVTRAVRDVPVRVVSANADVRAFRTSPDHVEVTLRGEQPMVEHLAPKFIRVTVDLTGLTALSGMRKHVDVAAPAGVTFVRVTPAEVEVLVPQPPLAAQ